MAKMIAKKARPQKKAVPSSARVLPEPRTLDEFLFRVFAAVDQRKALGDQRAADVAIVILALARAYNPSTGSDATLRVLARYAKKYLAQGASRFSPSVYTRARLIRDLLALAESERDQPSGLLVAHMLSVAQGRAKLLEIEGQVLTRDRVYRDSVRRIDLVRSTHPTDYEYVVKAFLRAAGLTERRARSMIEAALTSEH